MRELLAKRGIITLIMADRMHPKISVITPSFNQGKFLKETIDSVISQQYPDLEYIIIDGGSTDQSIDIIKSYASNLTYWISEKDNGQSQALNKGLRRATGEIVTWLNSDDTYEPGTLLKIAEHFLSRPDISLLHGKTILFGEGRKDELRGAPSKDVDALYLAYIPFPQPSSFFRRHVLIEQGFLDESLHYGMDFDLLARIALNYKIDRSEEIYSRYRMHPQSKSNYELGFIHDWNIVFSRILRSLPGTEKKIEAMKMLGLYKPGDVTYQVREGFNASLIELSFYYFLKSQAQLYYIAGDTKNSAMLFDYIRKKNPGFYKREKLSGLHFRASLLNPYLLKVIRAIKA